jgi:adenylate kinase family enzyme
LAEPESLNRIVVLGCAGSGKSTFANQLSQQLNIPLICLDAIWQPDWTKADIPNFRALMQEAHAAKEWISDGNFAEATFDIRLPRATLVIWLDRSRAVCAWRAITRVFQPNEAHRASDLAKVLTFIWQFNRVNAPKIERLRMRWSPGVPVRRLADDRATAAFLDSTSDFREEALH